MPKLRGKTCNKPSFTSTSSAPSTTTKTTTIHSERKTTSTSKLPDCSFQLFLSALWVKAFCQIELDNIHELINDLILARQTARDNKDYRKSDEIRNRLEKAGVSINDLGENTKWTLKPFFNPKKLLEEN